MVAWSKKVATCPTTASSESVSAWGIRTLGFKQWALHLGHVRKGHTPPSYCPAHFPWGARRQNSESVPAVARLLWGSLDPALLQP